MKYKIVIPARFGSSRLLGKPLLEICGQPMIWHTYQRALETNIGNENIIIATDHEGTFDIAKSFGANVLMTSSNHESGTSRLAEVAQIMNWDDDEIIVNLQGDEPLLDSQLITLVAQSLYDNSDAGIATLACKMKTQEEVLNPNQVKVICDINGKAIYFSRSPIPFAREGFSESLLSSPQSPWQRHIGMYSYRVKTLFQYQKWPVSIFEELEKLEQLRAIYNNVKIQVSTIDKAPKHGVDTLEDLEAVRKLMAQ